jgi:hypothetical protein
MRFWHRLFVSVVLLPSLFIYLFYRTDKVVVNTICIAVFSRPRYEAVKFAIQQALPLSDWVIYNLPGMLWVSAATLVSRYFFIRFRHYTLSCGYIPMIYAISLEGLQRLHLTRGCFDWFDVVGTFLGAFIVFLWPMDTKPQPLFSRFDRGSACFVLMYALLLLSSKLR